MGPSAQVVEISMSPKQSVGKDPITTQQKKITALTYIFDMWIIDLSSSHSTISWNSFNKEASFSSFLKSHPNLDIQNLIA